jgi:hypothetical protein
MNTSPMNCAYELLAGAHAYALMLLRHRLSGALIACMSLAGLAGSLLTFFN